MRPDSARTAEIVRQALGSYLSTSGTPVRSNFSIRGPHGFLKRQPGELFIAGVVVTRSRSFDGLLEALCGHLSALAIRPRVVDDPHVRAFSDGTQAVLTDLPRPGLTDDGALASMGVRELHLWNPEFVQGPAIAVPPPLQHAKGGTRQPLSPTLEITGVVLSAAAANRALDFGWLHALSRMGTVPRTITVDGDMEAREAILARMNCEVGMPQV